MIARVAATMTSEVLKESQRKDLELVLEERLGVFQEPRREGCAIQRIQPGRAPSWRKARSSPRSRTPAQEAMGTVADREVEGPLSPPEKSYEKGTGLTELSAEKINPRAITK